MTSIVVKPGQNLFDLAVQLYGDSSGIFELVRLNNLKLGQPLKTGQVLLYDASGGIKEFKEYFKRNSIVVSTAETGMHTHSNKLQLDTYLRTQEEFDKYIEEQIARPFYGQSLFVGGDLGNDVTAQKGSITRPFKTLTAAKNAAIAGDTIFVYPGLYQEHDLAKNEVNWHFYKGAIVRPTNPLAGIFTDLGRSAPISYTITGNGQLINKGQYPLDTSAITCSVPGSFIKVECDLISSINIWNRAKVIFKNCEFNWEAAIYNAEHAEFHNCFFNNTYNKIDNPTRTNSMQFLTFYNCRFYNKGFPVDFDLTYIDEIFGMPNLPNYFGAYLTSFVNCERNRFINCEFIVENNNHINIDIIPNSNPAYVQNINWIFDNCRFYNKSATGYFIEVKARPQNPNGLLPGVTFGFKDCLVNKPLKVLSQNIENSIAVPVGFTIDPAFTLINPLQYNL